MSCPQEGDQQIKVSLYRQKVNSMSNTMGREPELRLEISAMKNVQRKHFLLQFFILLTHQHHMHHSHMPVATDCCLPKSNNQNHWAQLQSRYLLYLLLQVPPLLFLCILEQSWPSSPSQSFPDTVLTFVFCSWHLCHLFSLKIALGRSLNRWPWEQ